MSESDPSTEKVPVPTGAAFDAVAGQVKKAQAMAVEAASKVDALNNNMSDLQTRVKQNSGNVASLANAMSLLKQEMDALKTRVDLVEPKIGSLESRLKKSENDITLASGRLADVTARVAALEKGAPPPQPVGFARGIYMPVYSGDMGQALVRLKQQFPQLPVWANMNPASGPGDQYTGHTGPRSDIQQRIDALKDLPNMIISGYTGTWYARATNSPPQGSQWPGKHKDCIYTQDRAQYDSILRGAFTGRAILMSDVIKKYSGQEADVVVNNQVTGKTVWYRNLNAIMTDELSNDPAKWQWFRDLVAAAKSAGLDKARGNAGTGVPEEYFSIYDSISIREGKGLPDLNLVRERTFGGKYKSQASIVSYATPRPTKEQVLAIAEEVAYMYITDDGMADDTNPYNKPSSYLLEMAGWLDEYNRQKGYYN